MLKSYVCKKLVSIGLSVIKTCSTPISTLIIFFLLGVIIFNLSFLTVLVLIILLLTPSKLFKTLAIVALLTGVFFTKDFYHHITKDIEKFKDSTIKVSAMIVEPPSENLFAFDSVLQIDGSKSLVIAKLPKTTNLNYADKIIVSGKVQKIEASNKSYQKYLNSKGIFLEIKNPKFEVDLENNSILKIFSTARERIVDSVNTHLFEPEASLFNGIILGKKDNLKDDFQENLKLTGTSHIISASGFNVITVYILLNSLSNFINKRKVDFLSIFILIGYLLLIGVYNLPALRATIMLIYIIIGKLNGKKVNAFTALLVSILIITIISPLSIKNISMQLSVFATIGLFSFSDIFNKFFRRLNLNPTFSEILGSTVGASIFTLPIIWINFKEVSLIAIPVNMIVLPLVPIITYLGIVAIFSMFLNIFFVSEIIFWPVHKLLELGILVINTLSKISINLGEIGFVFYFLSLCSLILFIDYLNHVQQFKKQT